MKKVKKKKLSIKKICLFSGFVIFIIALVINSNLIINFIQSKITGYNYETISTFHELDIYKDVKKHDYSDTLEKIVITEYYNPKYLNKYFDIKYYDTDDFLIDINKLLELGYSANDINAIYDNLSTDSIKVLTENNYLKDIINILKLNYFHEDYLLRYLLYSDNHDLDYKDLVTYVNANLDYKYYTNTINVDNPDDLLVIVNKYYKLDSNYVPNDLETISQKYNRGYNNKMRHEARLAFEKMCEAALDDNVTIYSGSAYRSYNYQLNLYNRYVNTNGFDKAETFSARAGYSEHQTGLATDIMNAKLDFISEDDSEYEWLVNNSYKYGFILRYPKDKENITGYMYEEWHFRYLGIEVATKVFNEGITYDEFVARN